MRFGILFALALALMTTAPSAMAQTTTIETTTVSSPSISLPACSYIVVDPLSGKVLSDYATSVRVPAGYYVAEKSTGRVYATTDADGNLVSISSAPAQNVLMQIQERRTALEQQIADALSRNTIAVTEVAPYRTALQDIASQEVVLRSGGTITLAQAAPLAYRLNVLSTQLAPMVKMTTAYTPLLGERVFVQNGQVVVATSDYAARRALMDQRIQSEYDFGRLTNSQVRELRTDLSKIANIDIKRRRDGTLSSSNQRAVERRFNELSADLQDDISGTNKRRARIGLKVD